MGNIHRYLTCATRMPYLLYIDYVLSLKVLSWTSIFTMESTFGMSNSDNLSRQITSSTAYLLLLAGFVVSLLCSVIEVVYVCDIYIFLFLLFNIYCSYYLNKETVTWILRGDEINLTQLCIFSLLTFVVNSITFYLLFEFNWLKPHDEEAGQESSTNSNSCLKRSYRFGCFCIKLTFQTIQCLATHLSSVLVGFYMHGSLNQNMRLIYYLPLLAQLPSLCYVVGFLLYRLPSFLRFFGAGVLRVVYSVSNYGVEAFITYHWQRLSIPRLLRLFWVAKCATCLLNYYFTFTYLRPVQPQSQRFAELMNQTSASNSTAWEIAYVALREAVMVETSDNLFSLAGLTAMVSLSAEYLSLIIAWAIGLRDQDPERAHFGSISAVLFFLLALQSGITALTPDQRVNRLYRNFCLLIVGFLHFAENLANSVLKHVSAGLEKRWSVHVRPLVSCVCLTIVSILFVRYLWRENNWDPWLLLITSLCFEVIVKVIFSVIEYFLIMVDSQLPSEGSVDLESTIYWVNSTGHVIEFLFGLFFFANGVYIFATLSGGVIRACMLVLHAYFNVWSEACNGWSKLRRRRSASRLINALMNADPEKLQGRDSDCCPICFMELELKGRKVKVTPCQHFYHDVCLRKWVQVKQNCPLCHYELGD